MTTHITNLLEADNTLERAIRELEFLCHVMPSDSMAEFAMGFEAACGLSNILGSILEDTKELRAWLDDSGQRIGGNRAMLQSCMTTQIIDRQ